jgi:hypothetical protein
MTFIIQLVIHCLYVLFPLAALFFHSTLCSTLFDPCKICLWIRDREVQQTYQMKEEDFPPLSFCQQQASSTVVSNGGSSSS